MAIAPFKKESGQTSGRNVTRTSPHHWRVVLEKLFALFISGIQLFTQILIGRQGKVLAANANI